MEEMTACVRAGLSWEAADGMTRSERHAFLTCYSRQEREAHERAKREAR